MLLRKVLNKRTKIISMDKLAGFPLRPNKGPSVLLDDRSDMETKAYYVWCVGSKLVTISSHSCTYPRP